MSEKQAREFQQLSVQQKIVASNIELIRQQMEITQAYIRDQRAGLSVLEELEKRQSDEEILLHIGGGMLIPAKITSTNQIIRDIGSGVRVDSTLEEAKEKTKNLIERLEKQYNNLSQELERLSAQAADVDSRLRKLAAEIQKGEKQNSV